MQLGRYGLVSECMHVDMIDTEDNERGFSQIDKSRTWSEPTDGCSHTRDYKLNPKLLLGFRP